MRAFIELYRYRPVALALPFQILIKVMVHKPVLCERRLHIANTSARWQNSVINDCAFYRIRHIDRTGWRVRRR